MTDRTDQHAAWSCLATRTSKQKNVSARFGLAGGETLTIAPRICAVGSLDRREAGPQAESPGSVTTFFRLSDAKEGEGDGVNILLTSTK